jgi:aspartate aminotransferase
MNDSPTHLKTSKLQLSNRASKTPASPIRRLAGLAQQAEERGTRVYRLNIGQPDVAAPQEFFDGLRKFSSNQVAYESSRGNTDLLATWCDYINRDYQIGVSPLQMLITMGASEGLIFAFMVCCDPGDEILIFDPTYANYIGFAAISGVRLVPLPCSLEEGFSLPAAQDIERFVSPYTRAVLLCNPNNPTGTVASDEELQTLLKVCRDHDLFLIVDETYREFVFDGRKPRCIFELSGHDPRVIVVDSLSKRFSLCGARIGSLVTWNDELMQGALHIAQARLAAPTVEQLAAAHMLHTISGNYLTRAIAEYKSRRDTACAALSCLEGVEVHVPTGGFYLVAKLPVTDAEEFAMFLLNKFSWEGATTFVAPANGFYMHANAGREMIRIAFVLSKIDIEQAIVTLGEGIRAFSEGKKDAQC